MKVKTLQGGGWVFYFKAPLKDLGRDVGKWMYFFSDREFAKKICHNAIEQGIVTECKHSDAGDGVCCFYIKGSDNKAHKRVIQYFLDNNLIRRTKAGKLYNIAFKYDAQTIAGKYGDDFKAKITLDQFLNLYTGEWLK